MCRSGKPAISPTQQKIPRRGTVGTKGVRNGRWRSGRVRRRTITPAHTIAKASSVPMLTSSPSSWIGNRPATIAATEPVRIVVT